MILTHISVATNVAAILTNKKIGQSRHYCNAVYDKSWPQNAFDTPLSISILQHWAWQFNSISTKYNIDILVFIYVNSIRLPGNATCANFN